ncbi:TetR/AcrR family transcriptional regulator [Cohnella sp. GCM10027633]|uniref:TetR/AcrR family transcriptional regulator n=1 Tax=unclassified Cohnella TaxID=2636738 RepID=UPI003640E231
MAADTRPDRRVLRTKQAIESAFLELFARKPFEQITINEIAESANVNRGTVYLHYADKYDLLDRCIEEHLNRMFALCGPHRQNGEPIDLIGSLHPIFAYIQDNFAFFSTMLANPKSALFRERMLRIASDNIAEKLGKLPELEDEQRRIAVPFTASALYGVVEWWILSGMPIPPRIMADQAWELFGKLQLDGSG